MNNFKVGEQVIALKSQPTKTTQPRIKGNLYIVKDVMFCSKCGIQVVNLGYKTPIGYGKFSSFMCCSNVQENNGLYWTRSEYFARPDELESLMLNMANEDNFEGAQEIKDIIDNIQNEKHI